MKPYLIVAADFTNHGGMDWANYELAWHLADRVGAPVHLVSYRVVAPLCDHPNVTWHRVRKPLNSYTLGESVMRRTGRKIASEIAAKGGRVIVNGGNCDFGDINWVHAVQAAWDCRDAHAPLLFRLRHHLNKRVVRRQERESVRAAKIVLTNSDAARQQIIDQVVVPAERVHRVYYGTDPKIFKPATENARCAAREALGWAPDRPVITFIGALGHDRNKGIDVLYAAFEMLCRNKDWNADVVIVGGGAEVELWRTRAQQAGLGDRFRMMGFSKRVPEVLAGADALVSPTHYDAYGLGVHEALCCGLPAFVTRCAGIAERYPADLQDLLLENPPSASDLAAKLKRWHASMPQYRQRVARFSDELRQRAWADMSADIVSLIEPRTTPSAVTEELLV
jgi:glycosyltransferase involved in cell wall biosynthesis